MAILTNYYFVKDLMRKYDKTYHQVVYALSTKRIKAVKFNWQWIVREEDLPSKWPVRERNRGG